MTSTQKTYFGSFLDFLRSRQSPEEIFSAMEKARSFTPSQSTLRKWYKVADEKLREFEAQGLIVGPY